MLQFKRKFISFMLSLCIVSTGFLLPVSENFNLNYQEVTVSAEETITIDSLPSDYKQSMDWIWQNRILDEKSTERWNLIFDQIVAGNGTLNYVIRWQSSTALTYEQRQKFAPMIERQINAWTDWLVGFEDWNYNHVNVNVVGWAVSDESLILDRHDDEVIYTTCTTDDLHTSNSDIPELLPYAPVENSRAEHFSDTDYQYPDTRFDMYLWGTTSFQGGAGGDWGQRVSDEYILSVLDSEDAHVLEHEIGHGFGMTDFYEDYQCPTWPEGTTNIMVAGWAQEVTDYDGWMLRYIWDKIKDETNNGIARFNLSQGEQSSDPIDDNDDWNFNVNGITSLDVSIKGQNYAGVSGKYYLMDSQGNVISQNDWIMSNSLGENGVDTFKVEIPNGATNLKVEVSNYFIYDSSIGDNKDLDIKTLNVSIENVQSVISSDIILGDLNSDSSISSLDILVMKKHLLDVMVINDTDTLKHADLNQDGYVNVIDLCALKNMILYSNDDNNDDNNSTKFITAPVSLIDGSLPSQGDANLVIFYIDFPDCTYSTKLTTEEVQEIAFASANENSINYPFESMSAFYSRSSKGAMDLKGQVFSYTAKNPIAYYNDDKVALAKECFEAFKDSTDFSSFDGDGDNQIDATLFTVPSSASDDYWWPCAGGFGDSEYQVDGVKIGHIITGNASPEDVNNFNSSYLHEMGHCLGLPDYYLYYTDDFDSMHGNAGTELMDADAYSDFSSFSKLMLGWYKENQVQVYNPSLGTQTFTLNNAQTDNGNCVIIPYGELDENYFSEYFIIEYSTNMGNNSVVGADSGIRIHHIKADRYSDEWWSYLKYKNGSEFTNNDDDGIRLIRLVNDGGDCFKTGDIINNSTSGFGWYDDNELESINPNVTISIGELQNDAYTITITSVN
ncbi:MAG: dockerin type I domain-containing protein [Oscillospiraceae bacterium]